MSSADPPASATAVLRAAPRMGTIIVALALLLALLTGVKLAEPEWLRLLRHAGYDMLQGVSPVAAEARSDMVVVRIGEQALLEQGPWPWPRDRLAELLTKVRRGGARAAALNVILDAPDRFSPRRFRDLAQTLSPGLSERFAALPDTDDQLAAQMRLLPTALASSVGSGPMLSGPTALRALSLEGGAPQRGLRFDAATLPIAPLAEAAAAIGAANLIVDGDMVLRRAPLALFGPGGAAHPSLPVAALAADGRGLSLIAGRVGGLTLRLDGRDIRADSSGQVLLDFSRRAAIPTVEAHELSGRPDSRLQGRIAVIGVDAAGLAPRWRGADGALLSGAGVVAVASDALLTGAALWAPPWGAAIETAAFVLGGVLIAIAWLRARPVLALGATLALFGVWVAIVFAARVGAGVALDMGEMIALWALLGAGAVIARAIALFQAREKLLFALTERMTTAEAAEQAKTDFLSAISHDLRGPLNAITGFSGLMQRMRGGPEDAAKVREYAAAIGRASDHMLTLANRAVRAAELGSGAAAPDLQEIDLAETLLEARSLALAGAQEDGATVALSQGPPAQLKVDRSYFLEALLNLLDNAIRYSGPDAAIDLSWRITGSGEAEIDVRDHGPGLSREVLSAVGTRFLSKRLGRRGKGGFGLGLHLVKHAIELHGGRLALENMPQGGLRARLILPAGLVVSD